MKFIKECNQICKDKNLKMHLDGARVFNAITALNIEPSELG